MDGHNRRSTLIFSLVALAFGAMSIRTEAQTTPNPTKFRVKVLSDSESFQRIRVPLYGSVTVETTVEVSRADVVAPDIADVQVLSPKRLLLSGQAYGTTNVVLQGTANEQLVLVISVELDLTELKEAITRVDPLSNIDAISVMGNIVLTGTATGAERATRIVELANLFLPPTSTGGGGAVVQNHLDVAGEPQVLLRCIVAEVARSAARELGVNGFLAGDNARDAFFVNQIGGINPISIGAAADSLVDGTIPFLTDEDGISIGPATTLSIGFPRIQLQAFIKAMADNSLLKILAEPNLMAISGQEATFLAGGEFPIPVPQGRETISIEFREFGVRLSFTPYVRSGGRIRLKVSPEVSEVDFTTAVQIRGFIVPGLTTRATSTTVELSSGETLAIAGLLNEQVRSIATRIPGIGDLPVLGALFRSVNFQRSLTELVILVTPEIVAPIDAHQTFALPGDNVKEPSDYELYALGLIEAADGDGSMSMDTGSENPNEASKRSKDELSIHGPWGHANPGGSR